MFGRLTVEAFQHGPIEAGAGIGIAIAATCVTALLFYYQGWTALWRNWITSLDPKRIGIMYLVVALLMLLRVLSMLP